MNTRRFDFENAGFAEADEFQWFGRKNKMIIFVVFSPQECGAEATTVIPSSIRKGLHEPPWLEKMCEQHKLT